MANSHPVVAGLDRNLASERSCLAVRGEASLVVCL